MASPIVAHGRGQCSAKREPIKKFGACNPPTSNLASRENDSVKTSTARLYAVAVQLAADAYALMFCSPRSSFSIVTATSSWYVLSLSLTYYPHKDESSILIFWYLLF